MITHWISSSLRLFFFCPAFYASWILRLNFEARLFITSFYLLGLWGRDLSAFLIDFNLIAMLVKEVDGPKVSSRWFCSFLLAISFLILASCFLSLSFFFFFLYASYFVLSLFSQCIINLVHIGIHFSIPFAVFNVCGLGFTVYLFHTHAMVTKLAHYTNESHVQITKTFKM